MEKECNCHRYVCNGECINKCGCEHDADPAQVKWWLDNMRAMRAFISNDIEQLANQQMAKGKKSWQWALATSAAIARGELK